MAVILRMIPSWRPRLQLFELPLMLLLYGVLSFALWVIIRVRYEKPVWRSLGWNPSRIPAWQALLGGCVLSFVIGALGALLKTPQIRSPFDKFLQTPVWIVIFGVFAVFLGPLFEEVVFRGFVQPLLARDLGSFPGIFVTAAAFGALHGSQYSWAWQYIALVTAAGVCFGAVRQWGRSLTPSIFMHAGFNAIFFIAALVQTQIQK